MSQNSFTVTAIPAFSDNYIWALTQSTSDNLVLVDPGDAKVCIDYIEQHNKVLTDILITHHHSDHIGGLADLRRYCQQKSWPLCVYFPKNNDIKEGDVGVDEQSEVNLSAIDATFNVIDLPGHTLGHVAYISQDKLFCGDTLFSGGCGRLFEGTPAQMHHSLGKLAALAEQTQVYCAHEYTQANLHFALTVEPSNVDLLNYYNQVEQLRAQNKATIPSSIALEKKINPFLRSDQTEVAESAALYVNNALANEVEVFAAIRQWKDNF
ncbi:hydroxyacylglutathione hydrolase [Thalassotalea sp. PLHSN55]|uniref:hydroxyacylglutathione hydrolase n=1 Tax=Thalassotalea sp. PLHSN55 TaxID=3435888 RepID=UPI003F82FF1B